MAGRQAAPFPHVDCPALWFDAKPGSVFCQQSQSGTRKSKEPAVLPPAPLARTSAASNTSAGTELIPHSLVKVASFAGMSSQTQVYEQLLAEGKTKP